MKKVYLDNASTTALRPEVIEEITKVLTETYGNPSSTHSIGRAARVVVENSRKAVAQLLNAEAREIIFTSGGTEGDNLIIRSAVKDLGVKRIITARTEHHAVLNAVAAAKSEFGIQVDYIKLLPGGLPDTAHLKELLAQNIPTLVSLMHVNNETGVVMDISIVGSLCREYSAYFHSDMVQSVGKDVIDLKTLPVDFIVASAHKFHGPKGIGFTFIRKGIALKAMIHGGEQEKGLRAGTEAVHQIAGMAKALELSYTALEQERGHIASLRNYLSDQLEKEFPGSKINGAEAGKENLFYNIVNVMLPLSDDKTAMILFNLDMQGIAVSRGSACQSGSVKPSHVLKEMLSDDDLKKPSLRISLSHYNTKEDIDRLIIALKSI